MDFSGSQPLMVCGTPKRNFFDGTLKSTWEILSAKTKNKNKDTEEGDLSDYFGIERNSLIVYNN